MDGDAKEKERQKKRDEERQRYLAMSDAEAESMTTQERYQRIRYLREKEAHEWLMELRRKMPAQPSTEPIKTQKRWASGQNVKVYKKWED